MRRLCLAAAPDVPCERFGAVFGGGRQKPAKPASRRGLRRLLSAAFIAFATLHGGRAFAQADLVQVEDGQAFDMPLYIDGAYAGDVFAWFVADGSVRVSLASLRDRSSTAANAEFLDRIERVRLVRSLSASPQDLQEAGVALEYDPEEVAVRLTLSPELRRLQAFSVSGRFSRGAGEALAPAKRAAGLAIGAEQEWRDDAAADGLRLDLDGFVSFGGLEGPVLTFQGGYDETRETSWRRGEIALIQDDIEAATRFVVGEFRPPVVGFQSAPGLVGVGFARAYGDIQPGRNVRAAGRSVVSIERASDVEIIVNGVPTDRLRLAPGLYDLRDLPYSDGLADVRIAIQDQLGRREVAVFNGFIGPDLLGAGVVDFAFAAGGVREDDLDMSSQGLGVTGYVRAGVRDGLTLGADIQADEQGANVGVALAASTLIGVATLEAAAFAQEGEAPAPAAAIGLTARRWDGPRSQEFALRVEGADTSFQTLGARVAGLPRLRALVRAQRTAGPAALSAGLSYERPRNGREVWRASLGVSRVFERFTASLRSEFVDRAASDPVAYLSAALTIRFGDRQFARVAHQGEIGSTSLDWERLERDGVGDWSSRARLVDRDDALTLAGEVAHVGNRYRAGVAYEELRDARRRFGPDIEYAGAEVRRATRVFAATAIGVADGRVAFGRELGRGFVVLTPDRSLNGREVRVTDGRRVLAKLDGAPVLAAAPTAYRPYRMDIDGMGLPDGYDLGATRLTVTPGARSGYAHHVGSSAITVQVKLQDSRGVPVSRVVGYLLRTDGEGEPIPFFTNANGRLIAERVEPGRRHIFVQGRTNPVGELIVPENADGFADLGVAMLMVSMESVLE